MMVEEIRPDDQPDPEKEETLSSQPADQAKPNRPNRLRLSNSQIILIFLILIGGRMIFDFSQRVVEGQEKVSEAEALERQIDDLRRENQALIAAKTYYNSDVFIETWAHSEGKMIKEGEKLVVPLPENQNLDNPPATPITVAPDRSDDTERPHWEVWWGLFFDTPPLTISQ